MKMSERILEIAAEHKSAMESDEVMLALIWNEDMKQLHRDLKYNTLDKISAKDFLLILSRKELSNAETVRRTRQHIVKTNPKYQKGNVYEQRQAYSKEVRKQIASGKNPFDK